MIAFVAADANKLSSALVDKKPAPTSLGSYQGFKLYKQSAGQSDTLAIDGTTALLGSTEADVKAALDTHAHGQGLSHDQFTKAFAGLPGNALVQLYGDFQGILTGEKRVDRPTQLQHVRCAPAGDKVVTRACAKESQAGRGSDVVGVATGGDVIEGVMCGIGRIQTRVVDVIVGKPDRRARRIGTTVPDDGEVLPIKIGVLLREKAR